nr:MULTISPECIES: SprT family zinc-dependent metalloprotease [Acidiphilium]
MAKTAPMTALLESTDESVVVGGILASIRWRRSARARRIALKIDPQLGAVVITLPPKGSRRAGLALLRGHETWVAERLAALPAPMMIAPGGTIPVSGTSHLIVIDPQHRGAAVIADSQIRLSGQPEFVARRVRDALQSLASEKFRLSAAAKASLIPAALRRVRVKDTTSRWGSCTADGSLMFSWRLVMAPDFVQDYVIAHEVAHLRHMNHAPAFWALTDRLTPHRAAATAWLHAYGAGLLRVG